MNIAVQIRLKLQLKENSEVEYKSAAGGFPKAEFWRSFSALANTNGGTIVLGVKEKNHKFTPDGLSEELIAKYRKQFWDDAHNKSYVNIPLLVESDIEEIKTDGGQYLLAFRIPRAQYDLRPIHLTPTPFGHTYKRRDEGDYLCTDDEIKQIYSDANSMKVSADSRILRGYSIDDIDMPTLHQYHRAYNIKHENHPWTEIDDKHFLENIGAYRKDRATSKEGFTVAGMLMFGKTNSITDPECCQEFFPDYREHLSDDPQIRWTNRIYPDGTWETNLYQFFTRVLPLLPQFNDKKVFVDLFGGSGLLSHITKYLRPDATVVYNDYDNYRARLAHIPQTNALLADLRKIVGGLPKHKRIDGEMREKVLERLRYEEQTVGYIDFITISASVMFSMKYELSIEDMKKTDLVQQHTQERLPNE